MVIAKYLAGRWSLVLLLGVYLCVGVEARLSVQQFRQSARAAQAEPGTNPSQKQVAEQKYDGFELAKRAPAGEQELSARYRSAQQQACQLPRQQTTWRLLGPGQFPKADLCAAEAEQRQFNPLETTGSDWAIAAGAITPEARQWWTGAGANGLWRGSADSWQNVLPGFVGWLALSLQSSADGKAMQTLYVARQDWELLKSTDGGQTFIVASLPLAQRQTDNALLVAPFAVAQGEEVWTGGRYLWRSLNGGEKWQRAGRVLAGDNDARFSAIAVAPGNPNVVVAGTNHGELYRLDFARQADEQTVWPSVQPRAGFVTSLSFDPQADNLVYATYGTFGGAHVWKSENGGATWLPLDGAGATALPDVPVNALAVDPADGQRLYVGSDLGVFVTFDGGENWQLLAADFGRVSVRALSVSKTESGERLFVFTDRRGLWSAELAAVIREANQQQQCVQALVPTGSIIEAAGGSGSFAVTAAADCRWTVSNLQPWIRLPDGEAGMGNGRVNFVVDQNLYSPARTAQLFVGGRVFYLGQVGASDSCTPTVISSGSVVRGDLAQGDCLSSAFPGQLYYADRFSFAGRRGEFIAINVSKVLPQQAGALGPLRFVTPTGEVIQNNSSPSSELRLPGFTNGLFELPVTGNYTFEVTSASPQQSFAYQVSLQITPPGCNRYDVTPLDRYFDVGRTTGRVAVSTVAGCRWDAISSAPWLSFNNNSGSGNTLLEFNVGSNANGATRSGYIEVAGQRFSVTQAGGGGNCLPALVEVGKAVSGELSPNDCPRRLGNVYELNGLPADRYQFSGRARQRIQAVLSGSGSGPFYGALVLTNARGDQLASSEQSSRLPANESFFELPNDGNYLIEVSAGYITKPVPYTLSLIERNEGCSYGLSPLLRILNADGGTADFQLSTGPGCPWTVLPTTEWITLNSSQSGQGSTTVSFSVAPNQNNITRTATLNIAGQTCLITQGGGQGTCMTQPITAGRSVNAQFTLGDCPPQLYPGAVPLLPSQCGCSIMPILPLADRYSFSAKANEQFSLLLNTAGYGGIALGYALADAQGNLLKYGTATAGQTTPPFNLPGAGDYLLELLPFGTSTYAYSFQLNLSPTGCEAVGQLDLKRFDAQGGTGTLTVTAGSGCPWRAAVVDDGTGNPWLTLNGSGEGSGEGTVGFSVARNQNGYSRTGTLRLGAQTFVIEQAGSGGNCQPVAITPGEVVSGNLSGNDCSALYTDVTKITSKSYTDRYTFTATAGQQVTLTGVSFVYDAYGGRLEPVLTLVDPLGQVLSSSHANRLPDGAYLLTTSGKYTIEVAAEQDGYAALAGPYQFLVELTTPGCVYFVEPGPLRFPNTASTYNVAVTTGAGCNWTARPTADWLTINTPSGTGSGTFTVNIARNETGLSRLAGVLVGGQSIEFEQAGSNGDCGAVPLAPGTPVLGTLTTGDCVFRNSPRNTVADRYSFTAQAGDQVRFQVNFISNGSTYGYPPGLFLYDALGNSVTGSNTRALAPEVFVRLATAGTYFLEVAGAPAIFPYKLEMARLAGTCELSVGEPQQTFGSAGGEGTVNVRVGSGCAWTARSTVPWITLTSATQGTGNGTLTFSITEYNSSSGRSGSIYVNDRYVNITQQSTLAAPACAPKTISFGQTISGALTTTDCLAMYYNSGGTAYADHYAFDAQGGQQVAVELPNRQFDAWLTIFNQQGRSLWQGFNRVPSEANSFVTLTESGRYFIEIVSASSNKTGNYSLKLSTPTVCNFVSTFANASKPFGNQLFGVTGGTGTVIVSASADCPWTAQSNADWLRTTGSGSGSGSFTFTVLPNTTNSHRAARLTINNGAAASALIVEQLGNGGDCATRTITPGERVTGSLTPGDCRFNLSWQFPEYAAIVDRFQFAAQAGDQFSVVQEFLPGQAKYGTFALYDPNGQLVGELGQLHIPTQSYTVPGGMLTLAKTGVYTLAFLSGQTLDYAFRFGLTAGGCGFILPSEQPQFISEGGTGSLAVQTLGNCAWTAYSQFDWITVTTPVGTGSGAVTFTVAPNTGDYRFGTISIAGRNVTVFQTGPGGSCAPVPVTPGQLISNELSLRDCRRASNDGYRAQVVDRYSFTARAGEHAFVKATSDQVIAAAVLPQATLNAAQLAPASDWLGNASFTIPADGTYIIEVFSSYGTVLPASYTLRLQLLPPGCGVALNPAAAGFNSAGGAGSIAVTAGASCQYQILSSHDWLSFSGAAVRTGNSTVQFSVAANQSGLARTGTIGVGGQPFTVEQAGANGQCATQTLTPGQLVTGQLNRADCPARVPLFANYRDYADRYSFDGVAGQSVQLLTQTVLLNWQGSVQISLYDPSGNLLARNANNGTRVPAAGDFLRLPVTGAYTVELATSLVPTGQGPAVDYTLLLTQLPVACSYTVTSGNLSFAATGGAGALTVATGTDCTWHAAVDVPWISINNGGATRTGSGPVSLTVAANAAEPLRRATITVAGQSFTIEQAGSNGVCQTQPLAAGQTLSGKFNLGDCRVPRAQDPSGNQLVRRFSFNGTASDQVAILNDTGSSYFPLLRLFAPNGTLLLSHQGPRLPQNELYVLTATGTYTVELYGANELSYALTLFVVQNGCGYSLSANGQRFSAQGGTGSVTVTTSGNCAWQPRSNADWITLQGGGSGNGTLGYGVAANNDVQARSGTIILANRAFVIEQAGRGGSCEARVLQPGQTVSGAWDGGDCRNRTHSSPAASYVDRYSFTAAAGDQVSFTLVTAAELAFIELYDPAGNLLASTRTKRFPATVGQFVILVSGTYGLHLVSASGTNYTLRFNPPGTVPSTTALHVNAASFKAGVLAPDSLVTIFGADLATVTRVTGTPTTSLGGTTVQVQDSFGTIRPANLSFVSPTQISYVMPTGLAYGTATITTTNGQGLETSNLTQIAPVAPGLFAADASGRGVAAGLVLRVKADQTQVFEPLARFEASQNRFVAVPIDLSAADESVYLILFGTGYRWRSSLSAVTVQMTDASGAIINLPLSTTYAGYQTSTSGVDQLNLALPRALSGKGDCEINLVVDGKAANPLRIYIK